MTSTPEQLEILFETLSKTIDEQKQQINALQVVSADLKTSTKIIENYIQTERKTLSQSISHLDAKIDACESDVQSILRKSEINSERLANLRWVVRGSVAAIASLSIKIIWDWLHRAGA